MESFSPEGHTHTHTLRLAYQHVFCIKASHAKRNKQIKAIKQWDRRRSLERPTTKAFFFLLLVLGSSSSAVIEQQQQQQQLNERFQSGRGGPCMHAAAATRDQGWTRMRRGNQNEYTSTTLSFVCINTTVVVLYSHEWRKVKLNTA